MFRPRSIGLLLALATLLVYLPATSCQFINFDDPDYVTDNNVVQNGLTWAGVKWAFTGAHASNWHPLTWLSHMADCDLFRLNPAGPHLVNILFHAANAALLFLLLFRLTNLRADVAARQGQSIWPSAFIAALFAWHPLHVESVAWISERKDVLSTFFTLLTLLNYARFAQARSDARCELLDAGQQPIASSIQHYWLALFFFVLALLSKPMPVTLPVVMLLLDYWPLGRMAGGERPAANFFRLVFEKWPFFLLSAASGVITCLAQHDAVNSLAHLPLSLRLENVLTAYAGYLGKMVWPVNLAIFYQLRAPIAWSLIAESVIILTGISILVWRVRKSSPWLFVGWFWFLVTLLPVIGLVQVGGQAMADRYTYFPLIGIFLAITFSAQSLAGQFGFLKRWQALAAVLILGSCVWLTENQLRYWHDSESLFTHALAVSPSEPGYLCVGNALNDQKKDAEAMHQYIMAWRLNSASAMANGNIGFMLYAEGKTALAAVYYKKAVQGEDPSSAMFKNYGMVLAKLGRFDEAMSQYAIAARIDPASADPDILMGELLLREGRDVEALTHLRAALRLDPDNFEMVILTANLLAADESPLARNGAEAHALAERLLQQTGDQQPAALDALAMADAETGQFAEAVQLQEKAVKLTGANGPKEDLAVMQKRLESYQRRQPWRESFKKTPTPKKLTLQ